MFTVYYFSFKGSSPATFETPEHRKDKETGTEHKDTGQSDKEKDTNGKLNL